MKKIMVNNQFTSELKSNMKNNFDRILKNEMSHLLSEKIIKEYEDDFKMSYDRFRMIYEYILRLFIFTEDEFKEMMSFLKNKLNEDDFIEFKRLLLGEEDLFINFKKESLSRYDNEQEDI